MPPYGKENPATKKIGSQIRIKFSKILVYAPVVWKHKDSHQCYSCLLARHIPLHFKLAEQNNLVSYC